MIHLLSLFVRDLEKSKSFYEAFGLKFLAMQPKGMGAPIHGYTADVPDTYHMQIRLLVGEPGQGELGFYVQSGGYVRDQLRLAGFTPSPDHPPANPRGPFTYLDPDGRKVSFDEIG